MEIHSARSSTITIIKFITSTVIKLICFYNVRALTLLPSDHTPSLCYSGDSLSYSLMERDEQQSKHSWVPPHHPPRKLLFAPGNEIKHQRTAGNSRKIHKTKKKHENKYRLILSVGQFGNKNNETSVSNHHNTKVFMITIINLCHSHQQSSSQNPGFGLSPSYLESLSSDPIASIHFR